MKNFLASNEKYGSKNHYHIQHEDTMIIFNQKITSCYSHVKKINLKIST